MQKQRKILVLGATGTVGRPLVEELVQRGAKVKAAVRDVRLARKGCSPQAAQSVEWVEFDYTDPSTYRQAFEGVHSVYLLTPVVENLSELTEKLLKAAREAHVKKIVKQSAYGADPVGKVRFLKDHADSEMLLMRSKIPWVILRPMGFFQNYFGYADEIANAGVFHVAMGSDRAAHIDARDVARCAARVLMEEGHEQKHYNLTGPAPLCNEDVADILSEATGDQIKYVPISDEVERRTLTEEGVPAWQAEGLIELHRFWREENAATPLPTVRELLGEDARPFEKFAREFSDRFKRRSAA